MVKTALPNCFTVPGAHGHLLGRKIWTSILKEVITIERYFHVTNVEKIVILWQH
jgi:hypothetical protein